MPTTKKPRFPALPGVWEWIFVYYEPLATLSAVVMYFGYPGRYGLYDAPALEDLPPTTYLDSRAEMTLFEMTNFHFLVVLLNSFVYQTARVVLADNLRAQEAVVGAVLKALAIVDITNFLGILFFVIPEGIRWKPAEWGMSTGLCQWMVLGNCCLRLAWFAGVGRKRYYYGQPDPVAKKVK